MSPGHRRTNTLFAQTRPITIGSDYNRHYSASGYYRSFPDPSGNQRWAFRVADLIDGEWALQPIHPASSVTTQTFDTNAFIDPSTRRSRQVPTSSSRACSVAYMSEPQNALFAATTFAAACADQASATALVGTAHELLDVAATPTSATDCAGCHMAPVLIRTLVERFPSLGSLEAASPGPAWAGVTRAFGYHRLGDEWIPVVNPRVRQETRNTLRSLAGLE